MHSTLVNSPFDIVDLTFSSIRLVEGRDMLHHEAISHVINQKISSHVVHPQKYPCADCTWPCDPVVVGEGCICRC